MASNRLSNPPKYMESILEQIRENIARGDNRVEVEFSRSQCNWLLRLYDQWRAEQEMNRAR